MNSSKFRKPATLFRQLLTIGAAVVIAACASSQPVPDESLARASSSIEGAETAGARQYASADLESAQERLSLAHEAVAEKEYAAAEQFAEEAQLDALLASAKTRTAKAESAVSEIEDGIATLRQEISRNQTNSGEMP